MKELSIEEKAKRYDEAIKVANKYKDTHIMFSQIKDEIFPELKESEDEKIRENIIATIHLYYGEPLEDEAEEMIAWLEKQGEQKSAEKIESVKKFTPIEFALKDLICDVDNSYTIEQVRRFLFEYGYKDKILNAAQEEMQKPAEWSEEDDAIRNDLINYFRGSVLETSEKEVINWLKSLRLQNTWKPSDKQLRQLELAIDYWKPNDTEVTTTLFKLWEDLKKLREE